MEKLKGTERLEALDLIIMVLVEHEKELDKQIRKLQKITSHSSNPRTIRQNRP